MKQNKRALITGITGQDGSYLAEFLLDKGYEVHGLIRKSSNTKRIDHLLADPKNQKNFFLHEGDLLKSDRLLEIINEVKPDEIYNLGAQSHVKKSFSEAAHTGDVTALGATHILDALIASGIRAKLYQASSSEMFGKPKEVPQTEDTPLAPVSPYGCAKTYAYWMSRSYRESYGTFVCNGILYNHESPRRGEDYVTKKITLGLCKIKAGLTDKISLGNLDARRDWGYAKDYIVGMWMMLQQENPGDYILATGETHTVRELIEEASRLLDLNISWQGEGINEKGIDGKTGKTVIDIDPNFFRPIDSNELVGNPKKALEILDWSASTPFKELVNIMIEADKKQVGGI